MRLEVISILCIVAEVRFARSSNYPADRITGGSSATRYSAPYIVSLRSRLRHFCAGSIIDEVTVITAAHCVAGKDLTSFKVFADQHRFLAELSTQRRSVASILVHPLYGGGIGPYDIALITVAKPFTFSPKVRKIELPERGKIHNGEAVLYGWGKVSQAILNPQELQKAILPILDFDLCKKVLSKRGLHLHPTNICTGPLSGKGGACNGDSGGPLVQLDGQGQPELVGTVSWGFFPCGQTNSPSIFTRISAFIDPNDASKITF